MKLLLCMALACAPALASIGDNAPSVPATYVTSHPRLPHPDTVYLNNLWANRAGSAANVWTDAGAWNSTTPSGNIAMRHLLLAYGAEKLNSGPNVAAFLAQIKAFFQQNGAWAGGTFNSMIAEALAYDWYFSDIGSSAKAQYLVNYYAMATTFEATFSEESPYNDQFYNRAQMLPLLGALSVYPDDAANSLPHLRFAMDLDLNMMLPVWKQIIGGDGYCGANTNSSTDCGGGWKEAWVDYVTKAPSLSWFYTTEMLSWAVASGRDAQNVVSRGSTSSFFTVDNPWMKNFMDWTMYNTRPNFTLEPLEPMQAPFMEPELFSASSGFPANCTAANCGLGVGFTSALAEIYNDATLRGWSREINFYGQTPSGFEPSAWPYFIPDSSANTATSRASLSTVRNFPGTGVLVVRSGWGEHDTGCYLSYGENRWSHPVANAGALDCYKDGELTIRSGEYIGGSSSDNWNQYTARAESQNVGLICDSGDLYNSELYPLITWANTASNVPLANDCGQRAVGSQLSNLGGGSLQALSQSPSDIAQYKRGREIYHMGKLTNYANGAGNAYSYACVDITAAYNNTWSATAHTGNFIFNQANTSNRSARAQNYTRCVAFVPEGTEMLVIVTDHITSASAAFVKKLLWHSINAPTISGNSYSFLRNDLVTSVSAADFPRQWSQGHVGTAAWASSINSCPGGCTNSSTQYQYDGKMLGWFTYPSSGVISTVGGVGHEFEITDSNGTVNHSACEFGTNCVTGFGVGTTAGVISPQPLLAPHQSGSWRVEETTSSAQAVDQFVNVQYFMSADSVTTLSTPTTTLSGGNLITTITITKAAGACLVTRTEPADGTGGSITAVGSGCAVTI